MCTFLVKNSVFLIKWIKGGLDGRFMFSKIILLWSTTNSSDSLLIDMSKSSQVESNNFI
jgi:hypothetical protein